MLAEEWGCTGHVHRANAHAIHYFCYESVATSDFSHASRAKGDGQARRGSAPVARRAGQRPIPFGRCNRGMCDDLTVRFAASLADPPSELPQTSQSICLDVETAGRRDKRSPHLEQH